MGLFGPKHKWELIDSNGRVDKFQCKNCKQTYNYVIEGKETHKESQKNVVTCTGKRKEKKGG